MEDATQQVTPLACDLTALSPEGRQQRAELAERLAQAALEVRELPDGYALRFAPDDALWLAVATLVTLERRCCPFLAFSLQAEPEHGPIWLYVTGRDGVKEFLRHELGLA